MLCLPLMSLDTVTTVKYYQAFNQAYMVLFPYQVFLLQLNGLFVITYYKLSQDSLFPMV